MCYVQLADRAWFLLPFGYFFSEASKSYSFIFRQEDKPDFFSTNNFNIFYNNLKTKLLCDSSCFKKKIFKNTPSCLRIPAFALAKSEIVCSLHVNNARDFGFDYSEMSFGMLEEHLIYFQR
jgi:hypothetical protein